MLKIHDENPMTGNPAKCCAPVVTLPVERSIAADEDRLVSPGPFGANVKIAKPLKRKPPVGSFVTPGITVWEPNTFETSVASV